MDATRGTRHPAPDRLGGAARRQPHPLADRAEARQHVGLLVLLLAVAAVALHQAGRGALAGPQLDAPSTWSAWLAARTGTEAAFALLRLVALATTAYLAGATALGLLARLAGRARWIRWADALAVPAVRRVLQRAFGAGLAAAVALGPVAAAPPARTARSSPALLAGAGEELAAGAATARPAVQGELPLVLLDPLPAPADEEPPTTTVPAPTTAPGPPAAEPEAPPASEPSGGLGPHGSPGETTQPTPTQATAAPVDGHDAPAGAHTPEADTWEVGAGDHFWGIAETVLARAWGRPPTDAEITRYWRTLIDRNAGRLAVPGNPDIVLVGQVLELAPVPLAAA
jgi:hypothetical protein